MDRQQISLMLALNSLGRELSLDSFDSRLALQKVIYLVQAAGVHLGYTYGWYLRGPYSRELTRDAFAVRAELANNSNSLKEWNLDSVSQNRLADLREMFDAISGHTLTKQLELLASVHFLLETRQGTAENIPGLRDVLLANRKDFSEEQISQAIKDLKKYGLFPKPR